MSIFTGRELEFLASLNASWRRLYWNELVRLLKDDDVGCEPATIHSDIARERDILAAWACAASIRRGACFARQAAPFSDHG
jgi:hypothetical protein